MFGLSLGEMVVLGGIALIAIDPKDLPRVAHTFGKFLNEMKRATGDLTKDFTDVHASARTHLGETRKTMDDALSAVTTPYSSKAGMNEPLQAAPPPVVSPVDLTPAPDSNEEQLAFQLTNFDDDGTGRGPT